MENVSSNPQAAPVSVAAPAPQSQGLSADAMSALSYLCMPVAVIALFLQPFAGDKKVRFNAMQALAFFGAVLIGYIGTSVFVGVTARILASLGLYALSLTLSFLTMSLMGLGTLGIFVLWIVLMVTAAQGKALRLPVLAKFADQMAGN